MSRDTTNDMERTISPRTTSRVDGVSMDGLGRELKSSALQVGSALKDAGTAVAHNVENTARETYDSVVGSAQEGVKTIEAQMKKSPLMSLGIAFGMGLLASRLLGHRS